MVDPDNPDPAAPADAPEVAGADGSPDPAGADTDPGSAAVDRAAADTGRTGPQDGADPDTKPPEADIEAYTTDQRTLSPRVRVQWGARILAATLVLGLVLSTAAGRLGANPEVGAVAATALGLLGMVWVALRYRVWAYEVRTDALYLQRGVLTHTRTLAPYVRIQHVDTSRGPIERGLGLSTLVVYTAGSRGADVSVPGLTPEEATDLQRRLKELAIEAEGGDAL
ncbi:MAG: membrane protein YdbS with pleckstrin-like domain [Salinirussus sp.]|jgi:membrane protein YdbS with pleckstrin-like domain